MIDAGKGFILMEELTTDMLGPDGPASDDNPAMNDLGKSLAEVMTRGETMRVTCPDGTDLTAGIARATRTLHRQLPFPHEGDRRRRRWSDGIFCGPPPRRFVAGRVAGTPVAASNWQKRPGSITRPTSAVLAKALAPLLPQILNGANRPTGKGSIAGDH